jgi:hypothetical protein
VTAFNKNARRSGDDRSAELIRIKCGHDARLHNGTGAATAEA